MPIGRATSGLLVAASLALSGALAAAAQPGTAPKKGGNPAAAKLKNPVAATPDSLAAGKKSYQRLCLRCHGPEGKGDGGSAGGGGQPQDFTAGKWDYGSSDGEIFTVIRDGTGSVDMEAYSERISTTEIWNLVNYVRSLLPK
jgi:mono/diheme cytochrome c family protein